MSSTPAEFGATIDVIAQKDGDRRLRRVGEICRDLKSERLQQVEATMDVADGVNAQAVGKRGWDPPRRGEHTLKTQE